MSFLFKRSDSEPLQSTSLSLLQNAMSSTVLSPSSRTKSKSSCKATSRSASVSNIKCDDGGACYYGDAASKCFEFFYGRDVPKSPQICGSGLFSYGHQTQMHSLWLMSKYPYLHPVAFIYSLFFLWFIAFRIRIATMILVVLIHLTIGESLKIERHCSLATLWDKCQFMAQFIGDVILIPYQAAVYPSESPLIQFQDTPINRAIFCNCKSILKFTHTFWLRNVLPQFVLTVLEEQYCPLTDEFHIYREPLETHDHGLIALDYWRLNDAQNEEDTEIEYASFKDVYQSTTYRAFTDAYDQHSACLASDTPILFIFATYCGDSMSMAVRRMGEYACRRGWRVISYTKRGCGSPYYEMLPLTTHVPFDLSGMQDAHLAVQRVTHLYPDAPKICVGFSLGGSQIQDYLARYSKHFIGGIKIDGMTHWTETIKFNRRQNAISKILGEVVHSNYCKSLGSASAAAVAVESSECEIIDVIENMMAPARGHRNHANYLHSAGPCDIERIEVPMLVINSWNDGFQDPSDMPIGIANLNPNIFHCVTRLGAHCIRREGFLFKDCWQSKVVLE
eukprot:259017_1